MEKTVTYEIMSKKVKSKDIFKYFSGILYLILENFESYNYYIFIKKLTEGNYHKKQMWSHA